MRDDFLREEAFTNGFGACIKLTPKGFAHLRKHTASSSPTPLLLKLTSEFLDAAKEETGMKRVVTSSSSRIGRPDILPPQVFQKEAKGDSSSSSSQPASAAVEPSKPAEMSAEALKEKELVENLYKVRHVPSFTF